MKKSSLYLREADLDRLRALAQSEGRSQAEIVRDAIALYAEGVKADRRFELTGSGRGDGRSVTDISEEELLRGFGA